MGYGAIDCFNPKQPEPFDGYKFVTNTGNEEVEIYEFIASKKGIDIKIGDAYDFNLREIHGMKSIHVNVKYSSIKLLGYIWALDAVTPRAQFGDTCQKLADQYLPKSERGTQDNADIYYVNPNQN